MRISFSSRKTGWFLLAAGLVLLGICSFHFYDNSKFLSKAVQGNGKVLFRLPLGNERQRGSPSPSLMEIQFKTETSQIIKVEVPDVVIGPFRAGYSRTLSGGEAVSFLYDPDNPREIRSLQVSYQYPWSEILLILASLVPIYFGLRILKRAAAGVD